MDTDFLTELLSAVARGKLPIDKAVDRLRQLPYENIGFARVDHHRTLRQGFPEVILGEGKEASQIGAIVRAMQRTRSNVLITRLTAEKMAKLRRAVRGLNYHAAARAATWTPKPVRPAGRGPVVIVCAGTSDIPVAEEAAVTAAIMGNRVETLYDVGVAGIHRLLDNRDKLEAAAVLVVVAGMEGALPSVVGGLVSKPVIAVPTSIGYGASFKGVAALLGMLNSCAAGVTVVNIDNGFGAGFAASLINRV